MSIAFSYAYFIASVCDDEKTSVSLPRQTAILIRTPCKCSGHQRLCAWYGLTEYSECCSSSSDYNVMKRTGIHISFVICGALLGPNVAACAMCRGEFDAWRI